MRIIKNLSIKSKLVFIILTVTILTISIGFTIDLIKTHEASKDKLISESLLNAKLVSEYCITPLDFGYNEEAKDNLSKLATIPTIFNGYIFDLKGNVFASYNRTELINIPGLPKGDINRYFEGDWLHIFWKIKFKEEIKGTIYIRVSTTELYNNLRSNIISKISIGIVLMLIAFFMAVRMQRMISYPILALADTTERISRKADYTIRLEKKSNDEIGVLYDSFNNMLEHLKLRENQRDKAEKLLRLSEEKFRVLYNNSPDMYVSVSPKDAIIQLCNQTMIQKTGYSRDEIIGSPIFKMYHEDCMDDVKKAFELFVETGEVKDQELILKRKNGSKIEVSLNVNAVRNDKGEILYSLSSWRDITDRVQALKKLKDSEDLLLKISENYPNSYLSIIDKDFKVGFTSGKEFKNQNLNPDDFVGLHLELIYGDLWGNIKHYYEKTFKGEEQSFEVFINNQHQLYNIIPLVNEDGSILKILSVAENITIRKKAEEELKNHRDRLEELVTDRTQKLEVQAEELMAQSEELQLSSETLSEQNIELEAKSKQVEEANRLKSEFLSNMSHELRTPLNSVMALSNVLITQTKDKLNDEEKSYLEIIERNGKRLLSLINDILDLSKIEAGKMNVSPEIISFGNLLQIIKENMQNIAEKKGITLTLNIAHKLPKIKTDESKLHQVLLNVVGNAIKFTEKGSVDIRAKNDQKYIYVEVQDTGIGISKEDISHVFDEFRQADGSSSRQFEGTGLGLAIANKLSNILGANIKVESELGIGSVFTVQIPIKWIEIA